MGALRRGGVLEHVGPEPGGQHGRRRGVGARLDRGAAELEALDVGGVGRGDRSDAGHQGERERRRRADQRMPTGGHGGDPTEGGQRARVSGPTRTTSLLSSTVDTTEVTDGRGGVEENPNRGDGDTSASSPRSASSKLPVIATTARLPPVAPYHSRRSRVAPRVRTPRITTRATGSMAAHHHGAVATASGTAASSRPVGVVRPRVRSSSKGVGAHLPGVGVVRHRERLDPDLVEGVGRGHEASHVGVRGQEQAMPVGQLDHRVGEVAQWTVEPVADHDAGATRAADAGDVAAEPRPRRAWSSCHPWTSSGRVPTIRQQVHPGTGAAPPVRRPGANIARWR